MRVVKASGCQPPRSLSSQLREVIQKVAGIQTDSPVLLDEPVQEVGSQCRIHSEHQKSDQQMLAFVLLIAFLLESGRRHEQFPGIVVLPFQFH